MSLSTPRTALREAVEVGSASMHEAVDAARTAKRAGAEVHIASLESFAEMPVLRTAQGHEEFEEAQREGVVFHLQRGPKRFVGRNGKLAGVELRGVKRTYDENGRFSPVYDDTFHEFFEADTVILAIGQQTDLSFISPADGIELAPGHLIRVDPESSPQPQKAFSRAAMRRSTPQHH